MRIFKNTFFMNKLHILVSICLIGFSSVAHAQEKLNNEISCLQGIDANYSGVDGVAPLAAERLGKNGFYVFSNSAIAFCPLSGVEPKVLTSAALDREIGAPVDGDKSVSTQVVGVIKMDFLNGEYLSLWNEPGSDNKAKLSPWPNFSITQSPPSGVRFKASEDASCITLGLTDRLAITQLRRAIKGNLASNVRTDIEGLGGLSTEYVWTHKIPASVTRLRKTLAICGQIGNRSIQASSMNYLQELQVQFPF